MGTARISIDVSGLPALENVTRVLGEENDRLPQEFRNAIRKAAEVLVKQAQARALAEPTHGDKHTGLRANVARGVGITDRTDGVRITTSMPVEDEAIIPRGMDMPVHGWRHPVFGNRNVWVVQHDAFSWFNDTMKQGAPGIEESLRKVLEDSADRISRAAKA